VQNRKVVFVVIVVSQFCGTSLWFATNAILPQLVRQSGWPATTLGYLTTGIQLGFIVGTFVFAALGISDKNSPSKVFLVSSILAGLSNLISVFFLDAFGVILTSRLLTGFFLAGVYPVGMKIASDWNKHGLGLWLGALVGALVLGTSFPHFLSQFPRFIRPELLITTVSLIAVVGGVLLFLCVPDGPFRKKGTRFNFSAVTNAFRVSPFRRAALGYFGHMWELYAMWAFVPLLINMHMTFHLWSFGSAPLVSFLVIGAGALGCIAGGFLSRQLGSEQVAKIMLFCSGACCCLSFFLLQEPPVVFLIFMLFWGFTIAGDSPQFSALVAVSCPAEIRGSAITMITCIGFFISIISIQLLNYLQEFTTPQYLFLFLIPGPLFGLLAMRKTIAQEASVV
jgi:MFS family permease